MACKCLLNSMQMFKWRDIFLIKFLSNKVSAGIRSCIEMFIEFTTNDQIA